MPDDRSSGFFGGTSFVRFNSSDNSGSISRMPDKKRSKNQSQQPEDNENEKHKEDEGLKDSQFVDRSAQLRATLNSLAMLNVASVIKDKANPKKSENSKKTEKEKTEK